MTDRDLKFVVLEFNQHITPKMLEEIQDSIERKTAVPTLIDSSRAYMNPGGVLEITR